MLRCRRVIPSALWLLGSLKDPFRTQTVHNSLQYSYIMHKLYQYVYWGTVSIKHNWWNETLSNKITWIEIFSRIFLLEYTLVLIRWFLFNKISSDPCGRFWQFSKWSLSYHTTTWSPSRRLSNVLVYWTWPQPLKQWGMKGHTNGFPLNYSSK